MRWSNQPGTRFARPEVCRIHVASWADNPAVFAASFRASLHAST